MIYALLHAMSRSLNDFEDVVENEPASRRLLHELEDLRKLHILATIHHHGAGDKEEDLVRRPWHWIAVTRTGGVLHLLERQGCQLLRYLLGALHGLSLKCEAGLGFIELRQARPVCVVGLVKSLRELLPDLLEVWFHGVRVGGCCRWRAKHS